MKTLTWNVNRATESRASLWEVLRRENPDIAMLQEVNRMPDWVLSRYNCHARHPRYSSDGVAQFQTVVLSRWTLSSEPFLVSDLEWVNRIQTECCGSILECKVVREPGDELYVVSVHSPAFPVQNEFLTGVDISNIKLRNCPSVFFTEILWSLLRHTDIGSDTNWIVAGDFNCSEKLDIPHDGGNREVMERLNAIGLRDCLGEFTGRPEPTFQNTNKDVEHQLDYCYANGPMLARLRTARVLSKKEVFDRVPRLSDHLPILCEFE